MQVCDRKTGDVLDAKVLETTFVRPNGHRGVTFAEPGDFLLTDAKGNGWGVKAANFDALFERIDG